MLFNIECLFQTLLAAFAALPAVQALPNHRQTISQRQAKSCSKASFPVASIISADHPVVAGSVSVEVIPRSQDALLQKWSAEVCSVVVTFTPANSNNPIHFGVYLPPATGDNSWNGKFMTIGNGLFDGAIEYTAMFQYMSHGFASMGTDTGHTGRGAAGVSNMNTVNKQVDWSWRAMAYSVPMAKNIVEIFYGRGGDSVPAYYAGCSTGGRQGLRQLEEDPSSFDGLLIGAPAWDTTNILPWVTFIQSRESLTSAEQALVLSKMQDAGCRVDAPADCKRRFDAARVWDSMSCASDNPPRSCFPDGNQPRNYTIDNLTIPGAPTFQHDGYDISAAQFWSSYQTQIFRDVARAVSSTILRTSAGWEPDRGRSYIQAVLAWANQPGMKPQATPGLPAGFKGKLILYGGLRDGLLPAGGTYSFFRQIASAQRDSQVRYFEIPGAEHCVNSVNWQDFAYYIGGPPLAAVLGSQQLPSVPRGTFDSRTDAVEALVDWVEGRGNAPEQLQPVAFNLRTFEVLQRDTVPAIKGDRP